MPAVACATHLPSKLCAGWSKFTQWEYRSGLSTRAPRPSLRHGVARGGHERSSAGELTGEHGRCAAEDAAMLDGMVQRRGINGAYVGLGISGPIRIY